MESIFVVNFEDGTNFMGGTNFFNTKWVEIPKDKKIKAIFYRRPINRCFVILHGYDKYYHKVEAVDILTGIDAGKTKVVAVYIMGKKDNMVKVYKISALTGNVEQFDLDETDDSISKLNQEFWRG